MTKARTHRVLAALNASAMQPEGIPHSWSERVALVSLGVVIVVGSALLWIGVPVGGFWVAGRITTDALSAVLFALLAIPATMVAFGWVLYRASGRYERLRGTERRGSSPPAWRSSLGEERASERRRKGGRPLIDVAMTVSAVTAMLVLTVWFFFFAELTLSPFP
jgi:hypothetical protein